MTNVPPGLPVPRAIAEFIAEQAIDLYRECLTMYDHDEARAKAEAVQTTGDGASIDPKEFA